jgi:hypothetical protein
MDLLVPNLEPNAAASAQRLGLFDLGQSEQLTEELSCFGLTPAWGGDLHMVESFDKHAAIYIGDGLSPTERREAASVMAAATPLRVPGEDVAGR